LLIRQYDILIKGRCCWSHYLEMRASRKRWAGLVEDRLATLLRHAGSTVPFYKERFDFRSIDAKNALKVLSNLPIVSKKDLNTGDKLFLSESLRKGVYSNSTGGSTGQPLRVFQDFEYFDWAMGTKYLFYEWAGWQPGDRILKIWGSPKDVLGETTTLRARLSSRLRKMKVLDAFLISPEDVERYVEEIDTYRPTILECYVDAAYTIAKQILQQGLVLKHRVKGVLVSAGTLYPDFEETIHKAFRAPVINRYGSREAGDIACTCPEGQIHVNPFTHYVEIVDENGKKIEKGTGRVILTLLTNFTMPLIRYEIGDLATICPKTEICSCGRDWQTLERVDGRLGSCFYRKDGSTISSLFFVHFVGVVHNEGLFDRYQIVQESYEEVRVRLVLSSGLNPRNESVIISLGKIERDFRKVLGENVKIRFSFENQIPPLSSGKYQYAYSLVNKGEH